MRSAFRARVRAFGAPCEPLPPRSRGLGLSRGRGGARASAPRPGGPAEVPTGSPGSRAGALGAGDVPAAAGKDRGLQPRAPAWPSPRGRGARSRRPAPGRGSRISAPAGCRSVWPPPSGPAQYTGAAGAGPGRRRAVASVASVASAAAAPGRALCRSGRSGGRVAARRLFVLGPAGPACRRRPMGSARAAAGVPACRPPARGGTQVGAAPHPPPPGRAPCAPELQEATAARGRGGGRRAGLGPGAAGTLPGPVASPRRTHAGCSPLPPKVNASVPDGVPSSGDRTGHALKRPLTGATRCAVSCDFLSRPISVSGPFAFR